MGIIETWTLVAIVLHFCEIKYFADLPVIDWPWHWSCMCLEIWTVLFYALIIIGYILLCLISKR